MQAARRHRYIAYFAVAAGACLLRPLAAVALGPPDLPWNALLPGLAVLGAAFLLSWTAEAAEKDLPQAIAVSLLALIAVLPEYAVDIYFAWSAGKDPSYTAYATANMTGSNRLLIGLGWSAVVVAAWLKHGRQEVHLDKDISPDLVALGAATLYSFVLPLKATLSYWDGLALLALFALYAWRASKAEVHEPELEGPSEIIGELPVLGRRLALAALFVFSAVTIYFSAEPFAEGLLEVGRHWGIEEFILVQWLAPLASEAPEFIVAILFALKNRAGVGIRVLLSSKVNQWTLLVGMLPLAFHLSSGSAAPMHLDARQVEEILLTSAQSFFALSILMNRSFSLKEALLLGALFSAQLPFTAPVARHLFSAVYILGGVFVLAAYTPPNKIKEAVAFTVNV